MPNKVYKALQKIQKSISSSNLHYQSIFHHDAATLARVGGSVKNGCVFRHDDGGGDSDSECDQAPYDVPEGSLVVYVGEQRRRFVIRAALLSHPVFKALLQKSAEELGYEHKGGLEIACEVGFFEHLLWMIESNHPELERMEPGELVGYSP